MKKRIFTLLLALLMALTLTVPAWAQQQENDILICDTESLLTEEQWTELELLARDLSWQYNCALYIVTVSDYEAYGSEPYAAAANIYNQEDFGIGDQRSGVLLLLSMQDRDVALYVRDGDAGKAIGKYAQGLLAESYLDYFRSDDWFGGFRAYLTTCGDMLEQAAQGHPVKKPLSASLGTGIVIGVALALVICLILKGKMKSVRQGAQADAYVSADGLHLTERYDLYTHTTETRQKISKDSGSQSGGGGSGRSDKF